MKLSTRGRYGLKAAFQLALRYGDGPAPLNAIAEAEDISEAYLEQLISPLKKAGLVTSVRGAQGGYELSREPCVISIGDVLRVLEGDFAPSACMSDKNAVCEKEGVCTSRIVWERLRKGINDVMDSITLQDMLDDYQRLSSENASEEVENN